MVFENRETLMLISYAIAGAIPPISIALVYLICTKAEEIKKRTK
jgi:hypothetical protein